MLHSLNTVRSRKKLITSIFKIRALAFFRVVMDYLVFCCMYVGKKLVKNNFKLKKGNRNFDLLFLKIGMDIIAFSFNFCVFQFSHTTTS